jgi:hypothetical protein
MGLGDVWQVMGAYSVFKPVLLPVAVPAYLAPFEPPSV